MLIFVWTIIYGMNFLDKIYLNIDQFYSIFNILVSKIIAIMNRIKYFIKKFHLVCRKQTFAWVKCNEISRIKFVFWIEIECVRLQQMSSAKRICSGTVSNEFVNTRDCVSANQCDIKFSNRFMMLMTHIKTSCRCHYF